MTITRKWAMPSKDTFTIKPIAQLLARYVGNGKGWIDPFAGDNSPAEFTNDLNTDKKAGWHVDAKFYCEQIGPGFIGALYDPPYSLRQLQECYEGLGKHMNADESQGTTFREVKDLLAQKLKMNGIAISFGWNTQGFGKKRGFHLEEILIVCHGRNHNDTLVTVERKTSQQEKMDL